MAKRRPAEPPCPHGYKWAECCYDCTPPRALGTGPAGEWRDDADFLETAAELWPRDVLAGSRNPEAAQRLGARYQGWRARGARGAPR